MKLHRAALLTLALGLMVLAGASLLATDPPHTGGTGNIQCVSCHKTHNAPGGLITTVVGNTNLCLSCHTSGGSASAKAFTAANQVIPADLVGSIATGTSHRWDSGPQGRIVKGTPNTSTGNITPSGAYTGAFASTIEIKISTAGAAGVAKFDWRQTPVGSTTFGAATTGVATSTTPTALGSTGVLLAFSATGTFVLNDIFYLYVRSDIRAPQSAAMATKLENGVIMCSSCHDQHLQALAPHDPTSSQTYTAGTTNNRHFQRVRNDDGSLCGDCHAVRNVGKGGTSHPVNVNLASAANTKTPSASLVLSVAGNVQCLTCHDIHGAPTNTTPAGMLLRVSNSLALCTDCHTLADTTTANVHTNPTSGILWPGDQYGGSTYPVISNTADRGACKNCHTPHGWPDANNAGQKYLGALGARQDNLCMTCHDGTPAKDVYTQFVKTYNHPVSRTSGRLVGCADCHNPHMATAGVHTYTTTADANRNRLRAAAGGILNGMNALRGVDGVAFAYASLTNWATPAAGWFTKIGSGSPTVAASGAEFEYQVCFKCHTYYSFGSTPPTGMVAGTLTLAAGSLQPWVAGTGTASFTSGSSTVTGSGTTWTSPTIQGRYIRHVGYTGTLRYVNTVGSNTSVTLSGTYGTTASNQAYELRASASFPASGTTVTGFGTNWTSAMVGRYIQNTSNATAYQITAVASATSLTITPAYGATAHTYQDFYIHPVATFTLSSTTVTGNGTTWDSSLVGAKIQRNGDAATYTIASVTNATTLVLTAPYTTATVTNQRYLIGSNKVETDVAQEFNPANGSFHPVVVGLNSGTGNGTPKGLTASQMVAPWNTNVGTQTMMCSDCHNTDAASPAAQGPHGSAVPFMLRGANAANWPNVVLSTGFATSWCANCHANSAGVPHTRSDHSARKCYECHIVVPHGGKLGRLIGDGTAGGGMPARYAYNGDKNNTIIRGFTKKATASYVETDCGATCDSGKHPLTNGSHW